MIFMVLEIYKYEVASAPRRDKQRPLAVINSL